MQETILIVGSGAREHAIAAALARSPQRPRLLGFSSARNPALAALTAASAVGDITSPDAVAAFARDHHATLAVLGPEAPLGAGVADALWSAGVPTVGPTRSLARIESSKSFARDLLDLYRIPGNPRFRRFTSLDGLPTLLREMPAHVVKDDGFAGGKGVKVSGDHLHSLADSLAFCAELHAAGRPFVVEEKLEGEEFSLLSFVDGSTLRHMPVVQDHKRAFDGDTGPNTGGMGTLTCPDHSLPYLQPSDIAAAQRINQQVVAALADHCGAPYQGILYGGFMATRHGVRLIEYNARFGDPECLNLLTLLRSDLVALFRAIVDRTLHLVPADFAPLASVCRYLVPHGYPDAPRKGDPVTLPSTLPPEVQLFLGAVDLDSDHQLIATGSRTLAVVATAPTLAAAEQLSAAAAAQVPGPFFYRRDIGTAALLDQRLAHMRSLRSA